MRVRRQMVQRLADTRAFASDPGRVYEAARGVRPFLERHVAMANRIFATLRRAGLDTAAFEALLDKAELELAPAEAVAV